MKLNELKKNETGIIRQINLPNNIKNNFLNIGLIEGNIITYVLNSPFNDPKAYKINGVLMAIREKDAKEIEVEKINE